MFLVLGPETSGFFRIQGADRDTDPPTREGAALQAGPAGSGRQGLQDEEPRCRQVGGDQNRRGFPLKETIGDGAKVGGNEPEGIPLKGNHRGSQRNGHAGKQEPKESEPSFYPRLIILLVR